MVWTDSNSDFTNGLRAVTPGTVLRLEFQEELGFLILLSRENWGTYRVMWDIGIWANGDAHFQNQVDAENAFNSLKSSIDALSITNLMADEPNSKSFDFLPSGQTSGLRDAITNILTAHCNSASDISADMLTRLTGILWHGADKRRIIETLTNSFKSVDQKTLDIAASKIAKLMQPKTA